MKVEFKENEVFLIFDLSDNFDSRIKKARKITTFLKKMQKEWEAQKMAEAIKNSGQIDLEDAIRIAEENTHGRGNNNNLVQQ